VDLCRSADGLPDQLILSSSRIQQLPDQLTATDGLPGQLMAAGARKRHKHIPLVEALAHYTDN
jgi:hypothetical protein